MTSHVLNGLWQRCPLHQIIGKVGRAAVDVRKDSAMTRRSTGEGESTLLPMLIAGLVAVVVGITVAAFFA